MSIAEALRLASRQLTFIHNSLSEAEILLSYILQRDHLWIATNPYYQLSKADSRRFRQLLEQRQAGWPLAYLVKQQNFFGRSFIVNRWVLIPRPESEILVTVAIKILAKKTARPLKVLEIGTGSGCLAVTLACELPQLQIKATDISARALAVARLNAQQHKVGKQISFVQQDLLRGEAQQYDLIIANLPYVETHWLTTARQHKSLSLEPNLALAAGHDGLKLIKSCLRQLAAHPVLSSQILLEHGDQQEIEIKRYAAQLVPRAKYHHWQDLTGKNRVLLISLDKPDTTS